MKHYLVATLPLLLAVFIASPSAAQVRIKLRGEITARSNTCGAPERLEVRDNVTCVAGYCAVRDLVNGLVMEGLNGGALNGNKTIFLGSFAPGGGCRMEVAYTYRNLGRDRVRTEKVFVVFCPTSSCSVRYKGKVLGRSVDRF